MDWKKLLLLPAVVAGMVGSSLQAVAQPAPDGCSGRMMRSHMRGMAGDPAAFAEQRLARLKTDLKITAAQEPLWQDFAGKAGAEAGKGMLAMRSQAQDLGLSAPERMSRATEIMKERVAAMEAVNESFRHLYDSLSPEQRRVADFHAAQMGRMRHGRGMAAGPGRS